MSIAELVLPGIFLHNRTHEYPVSAKAATGTVLAWKNPLDDHIRVTPTVNIIGSTNIQAKPILYLPNLVRSSLSIRAPITRR
jgi:hypothetical protein